MKETCITTCLFNYKEECLKLTCYVCYPDYLDFEFLKFHSEILSPWHFVTFWNVLPGIRKWKLCDKVFLAFQTFSPGLEKNKATKGGSENFPCTVTYILCVEKFQNHIWMHSCLPIPGRPFQNVRKLYGLRIPEWNVWNGVNAQKTFNPNIIFIEA